MHSEIVKLCEYLKEKEADKENKQDEDLGFEINFGAYEQEKKVSTRLKILNDVKIQLPLTNASKNLAIMGKRESKNAGESRKKKEIPKEFIKKIEKLGMRVEDADTLYESKIDWIAVYSENKINCTETGCNFYTKIDNGTLSKHMIDCHNYGEYPCNHANCNYIGYSKVRRLYHCLQSTQTFSRI